MSGNSLFVFSLLLSTSLCLPCPPGWIAFGTSCYGISSYEMNWHDAQKHCQYNQGYLLEVGSKEEQEFIEILMASDTSTGAYWLGLSDAHQEGTWVWQTSLAEALYTNWFPQNPHVDTKRNCAQISMGMDIDGKNWYDIPCEVNRDPVAGWGIHAICETKL